MPADKLQEIQKAIELFSVGQGPAKTMEEASRRSYQFWDTQPVPKLGTTFVGAFSCLTLRNKQPSEWHACRFLCFMSEKLFPFPSGETVTSHGSIEPDKDNIREEPYSLPQGFSWDTLDLGNPAVVRKCINTHARIAGMHMGEDLIFWRIFPGLSVLLFCKKTSLFLFQCQPECVLRSQLSSPHLEERIVYE